MAAIAQGLASVKSQHGGSAKSTLHCREMFSGHARAKGAWKHLEQRDVVELYAHVANDVCPLLRRMIACVAVKQDMPAELGLFDDDGNFSPIPGMRGDGTMRLGDKEIASLCANGGVIPLAEEFGLENVDILPGHEASMVRTFEGRAKFHRTLHGFVHQSPRYAGVTETADVPIEMFELADFLAYFVQKTALISDSPTLEEIRLLTLRRQLRIQGVRLDFKDGGVSFEVVRTAA